MTNDQAEFQDYLESGFVPVLTSDGSYTLKKEGLAEEMHARGGALSESYYIYYSAMERFFGNLKGEDVDFDILSVGLGMGYNEVLSVQAYMESKLLESRRDSCKLLSYETEKALEDLFKKRYESPEHYPLFWKMFEDRGCDVSKACGVLKNFVSFQGAFSQETLSEMGVSPKLILFDAYSNKTSAELWDEAFLKELLSKCAEGSVFATYAATGSLKRALKYAGFQNLKKKGFGQKRESTLAIKT